MKLMIYSPERTLFDGEVDLCELPGGKGRFEVLKDHDAVITTLQPGVIRFVADGQEQTLGVQSGYAEVNGNVITACVAC